MTAPSDLVGTNGDATVRCARCGADAKPGGHCGSCGAFTTANRDAETHGLTRFRSGQSSPLDIRARDEHVRTLVAAKGGEDQVSPVLRPQLVDLAQVIQLRDA